MRLQLTRRGDYAIRAMLALGQAPDSTRLSVRHIAGSMDIPVAFLPQVMRDLVAAGLVEPTTGRSGGYLLSRRREDISVLEIIESVEGESRRISCVLRGGPCGRDGHCDAHDVFFGAQEAMLRRLADASLADLMAGADPSS